LLKWIVDYDGLRNNIMDYGFPLLTQI